MFELVAIRLIAIAAVALAAFSGGWYVNGVRWENTVLELKDTQAKLLASANEAARAREQDLQATADKLKETKDAQIRTINARLAATLVELRNRPARPAAIPDTTQAAVAQPPATGGTGAFLYREDAEFLAREAARADEIRAALQQCTAQYEEVTRDGRR
jgi:hypothetical protein